ncbi:MAG TPA: hypothetical protein VG326_13475 [Tepidisphaeraceae bacterium]|jgi:hypothetical protein|nr:hypothetical protein [Tepidisphaeraceae bacterium]
MRSLVESLESRQLFSASLGAVTQDATVLQSNSQTTHADLANWKKQANSAAQTLFADLHHKGSGTSARSHVRVFSADEIAGFRKVSGDIHKLLSVTVKETVAIVADIKRILKKSTPALASKLTADIARLTTDTSTMTATTSTDAQAANTLLQKDLVAIMAIPSMNNDATKAKTALMSGLQTVMMDLTTFSASVTKLATDASA